MICPAGNPLMGMWSLTPDATAAREARQALRDWLARFGVDHGNGQGADIILAASEAAANAGVHGLPPVTLSARMDLSYPASPTAVIAVTDGDRSTSAPVTAPADEHGRGLGVIAELADWWEIRSDWNAKQVRFGIHVDLGPSAASDGTRTGWTPAASLSALI